MSHYIDNTTYSQLLHNHAEAYRNARKNNQPAPQMSDDLARQVLLIAEKLAGRGNFVSYTYSDDFIQSGVYNVIKYAYNFDIAKSPNGFSWTTQVLFHAYIKTIKDETEKTYRQMMLTEALATSPASSEYQRSENRNHAGYMAWLSRQDQKKIERKAKRDEQTAKRRAAKTAEEALKPPKRKYTKKTVAVPVAA